MKASIINSTGDLLYFGNVNNSKFVATLPGNTRVDFPRPGGADHFDGTVWSTNPPPARPAPPGLVDTPGTVNSVPGLRNDVNVMKDFLRAHLGFD